MKKLLVLILLPLLSFGQNETSIRPGNLQDSVTGASFFIKNHTTIFQKVYDSDLKKEQLLSALKSFLPGVKAFHFHEAFSQSGEQLHARLNNFITNYRRHTTSFWPDRSSLLDLPLNANVVIQVKDYKYRVTVSDIYFKPDSGNIVTLDREIIRALTPKFKDFERVTTYLGKDFKFEFDMDKNNKILSDF